MITKINENTDETMHSNENDINHNCSEYDVMVYNCLLYEFSVDEGYTIVSADVNGIYAHGKTYKDVFEDFILAVKARLLDGLGVDGLGGLYTGTKDFEYQEKEFTNLEEEYILDGIIIYKRSRISINIFTGEVKYYNKFSTK